MHTRIALRGLADAIHAVETGRAVTQAQGDLLTGSLGGARPKSAFQDAQASMILKFNRKDDRFDRVRTADRHHPIHYLSAKTLLRQHGETEVGSYPAFADELRRWSDRPIDDCHELFGRMLFNIATGNRDDHAKNHGVLHAGGRTYRLAPAFDLVPIPQVATSSRQAMIVGLHGQDSNLANALTAAAHFMLSADDAREIARRVAEVVSEWRRYFAATGVSVADMTRVESCFEPARISC